VKRFFLCFIVLSIGSTFLSFADSKTIEVYNNITKMSEKITPDYYKVRIENKQFSEALKELPEEVLSGNKTPYVSIVFNKGKGVKMIIENIRSEYASLFSMYEEYFKFSGISKVQNPVEFKEIIDKDKVRFYKEDKDFVIIKAWDPEKEEKDDNYALFYIDKKKWIIKKAVYYLDGNNYVMSENVYKTCGKYYLPSKIVLTNLNENTQDIFIFKEYKFNKE